METISLIITIIQVVSAVVLIIIVVMQDGKQNGLSAVMGGGGGSETFLSKNKSKTGKAKLANATKWFAIAFFVFSLALNLFIAAT